MSYYPSVREGASLRYMSDSPSSIVPVAPEMWSLGAWPLGAHLDDRQIASFAVYAPEATRMHLEIFPEACEADSIETVVMAQCEDGCWRAQLRGLAHGSLYGYRVWGRNWIWTKEWKPGSLEGFISDRDEQGNHFNPNKVLIDPYAREITHVPMSPVLKEKGVDRSIFGTGGGMCADRVRRTIDTAQWAPKSVIVDDRTDTGQHPYRNAQDASIYEAHVKNLTMHPSSLHLKDLLGDHPCFSRVKNIPDHYRGTYAGAAMMADYLAGLGINTIEFLPVHETDTDQMGDRNGTTNNWGYQTIGFFAPNRDYAYDKSPGGPTREFKQMVKAFHDAGIEVYLDVVYNHTAEGGNWDGDIDAAGFTCFGGFATTHYYDLTPEGYVMDPATGSSNQTNFGRRVMCDLVIDSLTYWHEQMGVDGFRFDLATVLGRAPLASDPDDWAARRQFFSSHPLLRRVADMAVEKDIEVIAEAWDLWGYEVGNFPAGWGEWNGRFRDAMRRYLKGDGNARAFMDQFNGDWLHFNDNLGPQKSINFVTAHDGFTMFDLVSFNAKDNDQPYPFGPSDGGSDDNLSWDSGGDHALRRTRWRNYWLVTFFARGVPMIVSGDEYGRSQNGNNNPWNLNTVGMWNNWAQAVSNRPTQLPVDPHDESVGGYYDVVGLCDSPDGVNPMFRFAHYIARLRSVDETLRQCSWGDFKKDSDNVSYLYYRPDLSTPVDDGERQLTVFINGSSIGGTDYLLMINMSAEAGQYRVPKEPDSSRPHLEWHRIIDTAAWAESVDNCWPPSQGDIITDSYTVQPWSIAVLAAANDESPLFCDERFNARGGNNGLN